MNATIGKTTGSRSITGRFGEDDATITERACQALGTVKWSDDFCTEHKLPVLWAKRHDFRWRYVSECVEKL